MHKQYYDHRSVLCDKCHFHTTAGLRSTIGLLLGFPEGCSRYGYSFHNRYPEDAEDCEGFLTEAQFEATQMLNKSQKKKKK